VTIRPATPEDAPALTQLALRSKAAWGYDAAFMAACRDELAVTPSDVLACPTFVAEHDGAVVGFYRLDGAELEAMFVEPAAMRTGVGRALVAHLRGVVRGCGLAAIVIQSDPHAEGFYRAMGAERVGERASASIPGRLLPVLRLRV
jgi:GNAT superfamily N-acetyltransferase